MSAVVDMGEAHAVRSVSAFVARLHEPPEHEDEWRLACAVCGHFMPADSFFDEDHGLACATCYAAYVERRS